MNPKAAKFLPVLMFVVLWLAYSPCAQAQVASATISGKVTNSSGTAVASATVSVKNVATGEAIEARTDSAGSYAVKNLVPGDYEVSASAPGFASKTGKVAVTQSATQTLDFSLAASSNAAAPSLSELGFPSSETKANPQEQARLDKRSHMLQMHQRLGLITTVPLVATVITGALAGGKSTSSTDRDLHAALGSATAGLYFASAYYAIFAPKIPGTKTEGNIRLHKAMAWIHGPGMILTPILGEMAFSQKSQGEKVHGIAQYHSDVAIITAAAYGVAILSVTLKSGSASRSAHRVAAALGLGHSHSADTIVEDDSSANR
ncbi:MAG TPA: carboxypeptidase-like regulatory domain-containing protein [Candidatus Acidoferrales bacterium]|nr:carboxypeptidase-like regulatory domain-containing protein [Candidatus Acidoferrales bacterium]